MGSDYSTEVVGRLARLVDDASESEIDIVTDWITALCEVIESRRAEPAAGDSF